MENKKSYWNLENILKSVPIIIIPYTIIREILKENGLYHPIFAGAFPILLIYAAIYIRQRIKSSNKEPWTYILMTIFCFPAGLYYIWKYSQWTHKIKIIVTLMVTISVFIFFIFG